MLSETDVMDRDGRPAGEAALLDIRGLKTHFATDDGVVQAVESTDDGYLLGVQWHPEQDLEDRRLFAGLVAQASRYAESRLSSGARS